MRAHSGEVRLPEPEMGRVLQRRRCCSHPRMGSRAPGATGLRDMCVLQHSIALSIANERVGLIGGLIN